MFDRMLTGMLIGLFLLANNVNAQPVRGYDFRLIDSKINAWVDSGYYTGASIIVAQEDKIIYRKYFGDYKPETVAYIASAGKWLAAATIAAVVDDGKLSWDDKVKQWLPEFTDVKGEATLRQLLSHTAGYPDYQPKGNRTDNYQTLKESVAEIVKLPADTLPGTKFKYGGLAMQVAGRMAELATGKDWETLFQYKIARPLSMVSTHFTPVGETPGHSPMLGGGARTSLSDYAGFLNMIMNEGIFKGRRILSANSVKEMQADQVRSAMVHAGEYVEKTRTTDRKDIYGLGQWREELDSKGAPALISSPSWAGAYPWIDKKNKVYGFFLARVASMKGGFNSFFASPVLPLLVRDAIEDSRHREVKRGYIAVDEGGRLFYEEKGKGQPVIFIHGHSFDHYQWNPQFESLSLRFRVIRYDVRGYGRSSMPVEFSNTMHARDVIQLMDKLKIKKAHIVGLSMGGFIATDLLALYPERLLSVTAASGDVWGGSPGPSVPWTREAIAKRRQEIDLYREKGIHNNKLEWWQGLTTRNGVVLEDIRRPVWDMIYKWDAWQPTHVEPRFLLGTSVVEKLKQQKVSVPVLVLTGDADAGRRSKLLDLVPSARQAWVQNAGHVSNLENPKGFTSQLLAFLFEHKN